MGSAGHGGGALGRTDVPASTRVVVSISANVYVGGLCGISLEIRQMGLCHCDGFATTASLEQGSRWGSRCPLRGASACVLCGGDEADLQWGRGGRDTGCSNVQKKHLVKVHPMPLTLSLERIHLMYKYVIFEHFKNILNYGGGENLLETLLRLVHHFRK